MVLISRKNSQSGGRNRKLKRASQHNVINNNNGCQRSCSCHMPGAVLRGACASSHGALTATLEGWCIRACSVAQSCLTLCNPVDCSLPGSSVHGDSPGKDTGVGCHALFQGIFLMQGPTFPGSPALQADSLPI